MLTALLVVMLVAIALLVSGVALLIHSFVGSGTERDKTRQKPWQVERLVFRHHRVAGTLITLGSTYFLWHSLQGLAAANGITSTPWAIFWWTLTGAHVCTFLIGLVILLKPSRLKPVESLANRRYELGFSPPPITAIHRPALHGLLIVGIASVVLVGMLLLLLERLGWMA